MYFKIAKGNVEKSFKDYTIYFLTLVIAVCIFYAFNAIETQLSMFNLGPLAKLYLSIVQEMITFFSIFVSIILASLMLYANKFLIKRRKKELAIYMILGMSKKKISKILLLETITVSILSLVIGIVIGICLSQGLLVLTTKLFLFKISNFNFIISSFSILKTITYFIFIYLIVVIFNMRVISKYSLLELITAEKKNEKLKIKNPKILCLVNVIGIITLLISYIILIFDRFKSINLKLSLTLEIIGTFLFFIGLSGLLEFFFSKNEKFYYKDLNMFIIKQITSKINTNIISITLTSIMLFFTIIECVSGASYRIANGTIHSMIQSVINVYINIYLGCIFLLIAVSILALQQLSDASDNVKKYIALKKIGVNNKMINQVVFKQLIIYFIAPFIIAIINSIFFIYFIKQVGIFEIATYVIIFITLIYILYFYLTFSSIKTIINKK